ncbi:hypothetical protein [Candidatus Binatus sp.]|uniref:hypothetical protein n=1 Tax=Candidatus Binatus sp. TaxID=2811406 RepID=UPI003BAEA2AE
MRIKSVMSARLFVLAIVLFLCSGCSSNAETFVTKIRAEATEKCNEGNQAACHTIVQQMSDTKVLIESTAPIAIQTPACNAGKQDACMQMAVLHGELSTWCTMGNGQACAAVKTGPWPVKWDEPALIDAAKMSCLSGQFKADSSTCQALEMM